jgi:ParB/RepB/Spo0J family partition protein
MSEKEVVRLAEIPIDQVKEPKVPIRMMMNDEKMAELRESMSKLGLIEPIVVSASEGGYEILAGHRRFLAARQLGWQTIRSMIMPKIYEYGEIVKLHENLVREDVHPIDEANFLFHLMQVTGSTVEKLATLIGRSKAYVSERLSIKEWPPDVLKALGEDEIVYSVAREFAKVKDDPTRTSYLHYAKEGGVNPATAKKWREAWERDELEKGGRDGPPSLPNQPPPPEPVYAPCYVCRKPEDITKTTMLRVCDECLKVVNQSLVEEKPTTEG